MNCNDVKAKLADLLLDKEAFLKTSAGQRAQAHLDGCAACGQDLAALRSTMNLLDEWNAPEPSAYFDTRLAARLREEQASEPAGWWERMSARIRFGINYSARPLAAAALGLVILAGGGSYAGYEYKQAHQPIQEASAAVSDLQLLDKNDQAIQQLDDLDQADDPGGNSGQQN